MLSFGKQKGLAHLDVVEHLAEELSLPAQRTQQHPHQPPLLLRGLRAKRIRPRMARWMLKQSAMVTEPTDALHVRPFGSTLRGKVLAIPAKRSANASSKGVNTQGMGVAAGHL